MKKIKKSFSILLVLCLVFSLAACGSKKDDKKADDKNVTDTTDNTDNTDAEDTQTPAIDTSEKVDLVFYLVGDEPTDKQTVEDAVNEYLLDKINATISFRFTTWTDWAQKYNLVLSSGEQVDMIYIANWINFGTLASTGAFAELDELLPTYAPELNELVGADVLNQCKVNGSIYAVPNTWKEYTTNGITYREDLRKKYDLPIPDSIDNFEAYISGVQKNEPTTGLITPVISTNSFTQAFGMQEIFNLKYDWVGSNGLAYGLASDYSTPSDVYDYWSSTDFVDDMKVLKKWADMGFWSRSVLSDTEDTEAFANGLNIAELTGRNPNKYITAITTFAKDTPEWEAGYVAYGKDFGTLYPGHPTQNGTAIVRSSENKERAAMALNLMMTDETLNRLVQYGIEGTHYTIDDQGFYHEVENTGFKYEGMNTWGLRNGDIKLPQENDTILLGMFDEYEKIGSTSKFPNINVKGGFTESYDAYAVERSALYTVMQQYLAPIQAGLVDDVDAAVAEFLVKAEEAGLSTIREDYTAQWLAYCEEYGYK